MKTGVNTWWSKAAAVDALYINIPLLWPLLGSVIKPYLEILMVKKQEDYLQHLFADALFRKYFIAHYETFISLFVDDTYELTCMCEVAGIINRVNKSSSG